MDAECSSEMPDSPKLCAITTAKNVMFTNLDVYNFNSNMNGHIVSYRSSEAIHMNKTVL